MAHQSCFLYDNDSCIQGPSSTMRSMSSPLTQLGREGLPTDNYASLCLDKSPFLPVFRANETNSMLQFNYSWVHYFRAGIPYMYGTGKCLRKCLWEIQSNPNNRLATPWTHTRRGGTQILENWYSLRPDVGVCKAYHHPPYQCCNLYFSSNEPPVSVKTYLKATQPAGGQH